MQKPPLLFLAHRIPFPPNKGDKIRSFHLLRHLAASHRVYLGAFVDDPGDFVHEAALGQWCADVCLQPLNGMRAKLRSLEGLVTGRPLTLPYYRNRALQRWVDRVVAEHQIERALVFSGAMAQYVMSARHAGLRRVIDFVDVDSDKWRQYAPRHRWPMSWIYRREGDRLLCFERKAAAASDASLFVSPEEAALFTTLAPRLADRVGYAANGVDFDYFDPQQCGDSPYAPGHADVVFTGAMDYWPNADAVIHFVRDIWPSIANRVPGARFHVVGGGAGSDVAELANEPGVMVHGRVSDIRPWIRHAKVSVAPLRVARGIQNKVLEAMALGVATVVSPQALEGIAAEPGRDLLVADAGAMADAVTMLLQSTLERERVGASGRCLVQQKYGWDDNLAVIDRVLQGGPLRETA